MASLDVASALASSSAARSAAQGANIVNHNGKAQGGESDGEDASMESKSDVEIIEENRRDKAGGEDAEVTTDEDDAGNFITHDKSGAADLTLHKRDVDEMMGEADAELDLGFSVFGRSRNVAQDGRAGGRGKRSVSGNGLVPYGSPPPRPRVSPSREGEQSPGISVNSTTTSRWRAPPGAFHQEEEDEEDQHGQNEKEDKNDEDEDEDGQASLTTPIHSPRRSTRTRMQAQTPSRPSTRSQPKHSPKSARRPRLSQPIPGALTDEDNDEHGQDDTDHVDTHGDADTEMDEQEEEEDAIAPLPSRASRRTRSSGLVDAFTATSTRSKPSAKASAAATAGAKGKAKARPSEVKTPARRSSRLSTASSLSPDHTEAASPTKKGRKTSGPRASNAESGSGTVTTRNNSRRKR